MRRFQEYPPRRKGFSFLELLTVVLIIGIIASLIVVRVSMGSDKAKENACYHTRTEINSALERYAVTNGSFATTVGDVNTSDYFPGGIPVCPVSGSAYSLNSTTHRVEGHTNSGNH